LYLGAVGLFLQYINRKPMFDFIFWTLIVAILNQYTHRICHSPPSRRPSWMCLFARLRLVMSPEEHALHHQTFDCNFAIVNGIVNPFLNFLTRHFLPYNHPAWLYFTIFFFLFLPALYGSVFVF